MGGDILRQTNNNFVAGGGNPLAFINPSDISSITILKDADATAIYGSSRREWGYFNIPTKKGAAGKLQGVINVSFGIGEVAKKLDLLDTEEYLKIRREASTMMAFL